MRNIRKRQMVLAVNIMIANISLMYSLNAMKYKNGNMETLRERHDHIRDEWIGDLYHKQYSCWDSIEVELIKRRYVRVFKGLPEKAQRPIHKSIRRYCLKHGIPYLQTHIRKADMDEDWDW